MCCSELAQAYTKMMIKQAVQEIGKHTNHLPRVRGVTLPMISMDGAKVVMTRLYYTTKTVPQEGTYITSPQFVASVDLSLGVFLALRPFEDSWHPKQLPPAPWKHERPKFEVAGEVINEFDTIYELYDRLIPGFVEDRHDAFLKLVWDAKLYLEYFDRHAEKPLLPYYEQFGGRFLSWVRSTAKR
jgi:hypothetical protein